MALRLEPAGGSSVATLRNVSEWSQFGLIQFFILLIIRRNQGLPSLMAAACAGKAAISK